MNDWSGAGYPWPTMAEFIVAMEHVVGPQERIEPICIGAEDDMEARRDDIAKAIAKVDDGDGVIILTDLFGGTPSNLAISLMKSTRSRSSPASTCRC